MITNITWYHEQQRKKTAKDTKYWESERTAEHSIRFQDGELGFSASFIQLWYQVAPIFVWLQSSGSWKHRNMCIQFMSVREKEPGVCRMWGYHWAPFSRAPRAERTDSICQWIVDRWQVIFYLPHENMQKDKRQVKKHCHNFDNTHLERRSGYK